MREPIDRILSYWFGELDDDGLATAEKQTLWFRRSARTDRDIETQFAPLLQQAMVGELDDWADSTRGLTALVILLDQFTRNIFRDTPQAFAGDTRALTIALKAIDAGRDATLPAAHRVFLYMPLEHAEDLTLQQRCVGLFRELNNTMDSPLLRGFLRYAEAHRDVIEQFGRFPHRNAMLGRDSTRTEIEYLEEHGGF